MLKVLLLHYVVYKRKNLPMKCFVGQWLPAMLECRPALKLTANSGFLRLNFGQQIQILRNLSQYSVVLCDFQIQDVLVAKTEKKFLYYVLYNILMIFICVFYKLVQCTYVPTHVRTSGQRKPQVSSAWSLWLGLLVQKLQRSSLSWHALAFQVHTITPGIFMWTLGIQYRASCLPAECLIDRAICNHRLYDVLVTLKHTIQSPC